MERDRLNAKRRCPGIDAGRATRRAQARRSMYHYCPTPQEIPPGDPDDAFLLYFKTVPVVVIYGNGTRLHADEHNHAGRLMKLLDSLGKEGLPIRGMIRGNRTLCRSSLRALNTYLRYCDGLTAFRRGHPHFMPAHRFGWEDLQELLGLRWVFWS
jgi:hypothetical protein